MYFGLRVKHSLFVLEFNESLISSTDFGKTVKYQNLLNSVQREPSCTMRKDGRTDRQIRTRLKAAFRNVVNDA